jgi:hypothetical protein
MPVTNIYHKSYNFEKDSTRDLEIKHEEIKKILERRQKLQEGIDKAKYFYFKSY